MEPDTNNYEQPLRDYLKGSNGFDAWVQWDSWTILLNIGYTPSMKHIWITILCFTISYDY